MLQAYDTFEWTTDGTLIAPVGLFLAGATRSPSKNGKQTVVRGREVWDWHAGGRLLTKCRTGWVLDGRMNGPCRLVWFESFFHDEIASVKSIRHWLRAERMVLHAYAEREIDTFEALTQIELALEFVERPGGQPSWKPDPSSVH